MQFWEVDCFGYYAQTNLSENKHSKADQCSNVWSLMAYWKGEVQVITYPIKGLTATSKKLFYSDRKLTILFLFPLVSIWRQSLPVFVLSSSV